MAETLKPEKAIEVFISYAHEDERLKDELAKHLRILKRQRIINDWSDRDISAGEDWKGAIDTQLEAARVILLLVSADFIASDFCYDIELKRAMERHEAGNARVIPVILRPADWKGAPFGRLQALPKDAKPVTNWENQDEAFTNIAQGIRKAIEELAPLHTPSDGPSPIRGSSTPTSSTRTLLVPPALPLILNPVGRDREIERVFELLKLHTSVVITGIAGVGKTTVMSDAVRKISASEHSLYTHLSYYRIVESDKVLEQGGRVIVKSNSMKLEERLDKVEERLNQLLLKLITSLNPQAKVDSGKSEDLFKQAQRMVVQRDVLFAIDNADDEESHQVVQKVLEELSQVTFLVTSRREVWRHLARVSLEGLSDSSGVKLFEGDFDNTLGAEMRQAVASLCKRTQGHPMMITRLALDLAREGRESQLSEQDMLAKLQSINVSRNIDQDLVQRFDSVRDGLPENCRTTLDAIGLLETATLRVDLIRQVALVSMMELQLLQGQHLINFHLDRYRFTVHELVRGWCRAKLDEFNDDLRKKEHIEQLEARIVEFYCRFLKQRRQGKPEDLIEIDAEWPNILGLIDKVSDPHLVLTLVDETIGDHFDDPNGYVPRRKQMISLLGDDRSEKPSDNRSEKRSGNRSEKLLMFAKEVGGLLGARIEKNLGHFYYWRGNHEKAEELFLRSRDRYKKEGDIIGEIATTWLLGYLADDENRYQDAQDLYGKGTELAGRVIPYDKELVAVGHHLIGCTFHHQGRFREAEAELLRAQALINQNSTPHLVARNDRRLGTVAMELGRTIEAAKILGRTARLVRRIERPRDAARIARHRGILHLKHDRLDKAARLLEQALLGFKELQAERGKGYTFRGQAMLHRKKGNLKKAEQLCEESLNIAIKTGSLFGEAAAHEEMANILEAEGATEKEVNRMRQRACNIYTVIGHQRAQALMKYLKEVGAVNVQLPVELRGKVQGVLFDLMDTLAYMNPDFYETTHQNFAKHLGVSWERFQWAWASSRERSSTGSFKTTRDRIQWVANTLEAPLTDESQYLDLASQEEMMWRDGVSLYDGTIALLQELSGLNLRLAIVSNGPIAMSCLPEALGLSSLVSSFKLSSEVGVTKPNRVIYERALESIGLKPSQCIFVGDGNDRELDGARKLGMYAIKIKRPQAPYANLKATSLDWDLEVNDLETIVSLIRSGAAVDTL